MGSNELAKINDALVAKRDRGLKMVKGNEALVDSLHMAYVTACQNPTKNPGQSESVGEKLQACPPSEHYRAYMIMCGYGLPPNGNDAALIPYSKTINYQPMAGGFLKLLGKSEQVFDFRTVSIYEDDEYEDKGEFVPIAEAPFFYRRGEGKREKGTFIKAITVCRLRGDSMWRFYTMDLAEMVKREAQASGGKGGSPAYKGWWDAMVQAKAARLACKRLPISFEGEDVRGMITLHDQLEVGEAGMKDLEVRAGDAPEAAPDPVAEAKDVTPPAKPEPQVVDEPITGEFAAQLKMCVESVWKISPADLEVKAGLEEGTISVLLSTQDILPDEATLEAILGAVDAKPGDRQLLAETRAKEEAS